IEICGTKSRQIYISTVCASEIRQCYAHDTQGSGLNHEGIDFAFDCCWNLVKNNICVNAGNPAIIFGDGQGVSAISSLTTITIPLASESSMFVIQGNSHRQSQKR